MNAPREYQLELPAILRQKLLEFRRRVWMIKSVEALAVVACGLLATYVLVYLSDRIWDTPASIRGLILLGAFLVGASLPLAIYRWIWKNRRLDQLACLLRGKHPAIGDQLLGIIELVRDEEEQARSRELCAAAVEQVSEMARHRDLRDGVPTSRHRLWSGLAASGLLLVAVLAVFSPAAARNAWSRYLLPWRDTPRYTFAMIDPQPAERVVPHGEPFTLAVRLQDNSVWRPEKAWLRLAGGPQQEAALVDGAYRFDCPPQLAKTSLDITVGDFSHTMRIEPKPRPELASVMAQARLPEYLRREQIIEKDVRGGTATFVKGTQAKVIASASRELARATVDGTPVEPDGPSVASDWSGIDEETSLKMEWEDTFGLAGQQPFELTLRARDDQAPTVVCEGLPRQKVVLDSETLTFQVRGLDDFGVKQVGIEWRGFDTALTSKPASGERLLGSGSPTSEEVQLSGTFSAKAHGIEPQPLQVRLFVEDYLPDRERSYSPTYTLFVLSPEDHAIWLTEQLSKWHRHSLEVRDRELQLYETNKQLRELSAAELDDAGTRREIERQASAERTNGRRLNRLVGIGEDLVKQASRNDEFGVGHLEKWAEMLQILKDISANRMPSVADLLGDAAKAEQLAAAGQAKPQESAPQVGQNRAPGGNAAPPVEEDPSQKPGPAAPSIVDTESSQQPRDPSDALEEPSPGNSGSGRLTLPVTTLVGGASKGDSCPAGQKMEEAITEQRDLLNEFEKVAEELNQVLANLEGSTLVKRLKAASRAEYKIAGRIGEHASDAFGIQGFAEKSLQTLFKDLRKEQTTTAQKVSYIMDDMQAYYERRRMVKFKDVLTEMEQEDVLGGLRDLSDELTVESGLAMAQCEFWSDTMDRWAEDLVDPAGGGT